LTTADRPSVEQLLLAASQLDRADQERLLDGLARLVQEASRKRTSITALRGLGREIWDGVDAQAYVDAERNSWGG
jgi:hypothetical protein